VLLDPVLDIANAFFGAFFGFWLTEYMGALQTAKTDVLVTAVFLLALLLSLSLHILGFASVLGLGRNPLAKTVLKKSLSSIVAVVFFIAPVCVAASRMPELMFKSSYGIIIYLWWLAVLIGAIIFRSESERV
jgi:hypothetical protein